jgi:hypothetical protein
MGMRKIQIGDVFEVFTSGGRGYFQYVYNNRTIGELIRILPGLYLEQPQDLLSIVMKKELYFIHFPLKAAYKQRLVRLIGNFSLPIELQLPKKMRDKYSDKNGKLICWHIVDYNTWKNESVKVLTEEQKKLSPWGTWNDTLLIQRLVEGWTLDKWI